MARARWISECPTRQPQSRRLPRAAISNPQSPIRNPQLIDLHVHSTASDGEVDPAGVVARARAASLSAFALTDHDTIAGMTEAVAAADAAGIRVICGCEFSVAVRWGEMHLLAYFLPPDNADLAAFLADQRDKRATRGREIVARLRRLGVNLTERDVLRESAGGAVGRPHVARALMAAGQVRDLNEAFDRYIGWGRPAFVAKDLPDVHEVTALIARIGGVTSAAHLGQRANHNALAELREKGVDGVEVRHPAHDDDLRERIRRLAGSLRLLPTGGSDWHGDANGSPERGPLGSQDVPAEWLVALETRHRERVGA